MGNWNQAVIPGFRRVLSTLFGLFVNQEQKLRYDIYQRPEVSRLVDISTLKQL